MSGQRVLVAGLCGLLVATALAAGPRPVAVSPGSPTGARIADTCPTFSWDAVAGAAAHELVVYRVGEDGQEAEPVLRQEIPGSASSWTPALGQCLERGDRYGWTVRAVGREAASEWSPPSLFEVAAGPSHAEFEEALALVTAFLAERRLGEGSHVGISPVAEPPEARLAGDEERGEGQPDGAGPTPTPPSWGIHAESPEESGTSHGIAGVSRSLLGSGLVAVNTAGGIDLLLSGWEDGATDARITQSGIDRPSASSETFTIENSGAGTMSLIVAGEVAASTLSGDGSGLTGVPAADLGCTECVSAAEIEPKAVLGPHIAGDEIESWHLAPDAVRSPDIQDGQVLSQDIGTDAVEAAEIATGAVGSDEILNNSIQQIDIATDAVGAEEIQLDAVGWGEIATGAVRASEIATDAVGALEIATDSVDSDEIAADAVRASEIANGAVGGSELSLITPVFVSCSSWCDDSSLGDICDIAGAGWEPLAVLCDHEIDHHTSPYIPRVPCGGDRCFTVAFSRTQALGEFCRAGNPPDAIVFCISPGVDS